MLVSSYPVVINYSDQSSFCAVINSKTAEKRLQFGAAKCKTMLIGENHNNFVVNNSLSVDTWKVEYQHDDDEDKLVETFGGQTNIENTDQQKYLGFFLSSKGDNMVHIKEMEKKSIMKYSISSF